MPLLAYNLTGAPLPLAAGNPIVTLAASAAPPARGMAYNVTSELRPNLTVDPTHGKTGGLAAGAYALLQAQVTAGSVAYEWTSDPEYLTPGLAVSGPEPGLHAATHENGGADEISIAGLSGVAADPQNPVGHNTSHENGGADEISIAGLSGQAADPQVPDTHATFHEPGGGDAMAVDAAAATGSLRSLGTGATQAAAGNDGRFPTTQEKAALGAASPALGATNPPLTNNDLTVARVATAVQNIYLDLTAGSDANDGLTVLTPKLTWQAAFDLLKDIHKANACLNVVGVSAAAGSAYCTVNVRKGFVVLVDGGSAKTVVPAAGGVSFVADIGTSSSVGKVGAGWAVNGLKGALVEITGPVGNSLIGQTRMIHSNTADTITPSRNWSTTALNAEFRIVRPATTVNGSQNHVFRNIGEGLLQVQNIHFGATSQPSVQRSPGLVTFSHVTLAQTHAASPIGPYAFYVYESAFVNFDRSLIDPVTFATKNALTDSQAGVGQMSGNGWVYFRGCQGGIYCTATVLKTLRIAKVNYGHIFQGTNIESYGIIDSWHVTGTQLTVLNSVVGGYAITQFGGHATKAPLLIYHSALGVGDGCKLIPALATAIHGVEMIAGDFRAEAIVGSGFAGLGVFAPGKSTILTKAGSPPTLTGALGDFGFDTVQASLDLSVPGTLLDTVLESLVAGAAGNAVTFASANDARASLNLSGPGTLLDTVIESVAVGVGGNLITFASVNDGGGIDSITRAGNNFTLHYTSGATTVAQVEALIAALAGPDHLIQVKTPGTPANILVDPGDTFAATNLAGGANERITRVGTAYTLHYASGLTTVAQVEAFINALTGADKLIAVKTPGTAANVLTNPGDTFAATNFTGGLDVVAASANWDAVDAGVEAFSNREQSVARKYTYAA